MNKTIWIAWAIRGSVTILAFAGLAVWFNHWWIVLFAALFCRILRRGVMAEVMKVDRMPDLKNCPFCNGNPKTEVAVTKQSVEESFVDFSVVCTDCGISKTVRLKIRRSGACFMDVEKAMDGAILAWNRRASNG